jgi:hypothetical protein
VIRNGCCFASRFHVENYFTKPVTLIGAPSTGIAPTGTEAILAAQRAPVLAPGRGPTSLQEHT